MKHMLFRIVVLVHTKITAMKTILFSTILILLMGCGGGTLAVPQAPKEEVGIKITDRQIIESDGMYNSTPARSKQRIERGCLLI
jgi:hypothetical protein